MPVVPGSHAAARHWLRAGTSHKVRRPAIVLHARCDDSEMGCYAQVCQRRRIGTVLTQSLEPPYALDAGIPAFCLRSGRTPCQYILCHQVRASF